MKCKSCPNEEMEFKKMDVTFWKEGKLIVIEDVWAYECPTCGDRVFDEKTTENILNAIKNKPAKKFIKTPVYSISK